MSNVFTYSSREFTRDVAAAKRAAQDGTVFITERGHPAYVLLDIQRYSQMVEAKSLSLLEAMQQIPGAGDVEFEPVPVQIQLQDVDFD